MRTGSGTYSSTFENDIVKILEKEPQFREPLERILKVYLNGSGLESINRAPKLVRKVENLYQKLSN